MAWHVAYLNRMDAKDFPDLADITDPKPAVVEQTDAQMMHSLRLWKAVLKGKTLS